MTVVPRKRPSPVVDAARLTLGSAIGRTLSRGPELAEFEAAIAERLRGASVAAVGSGRFALLLVLEALGVQPGARILLAAYNASCVPNMLQAAGYGLHFVDVRADTLHLDASLLPDTPPPDTGALIVTHVEGSPAPMADFRDWARGHHLPLVEDAAHALGATLEGRPIGTLGDGAIFSLGRGKHLNTLGGGLAVVRTPEHGARLRELADALPAPEALGLVRSVLMESAVRAGTHPLTYATIVLPALRLARRLGKDPLSSIFEDDKGALDAVPEGSRRRLSNLQARFGLAGLAAFDAALQRRRGHARALYEALRDHVALQEPVPGASPAWLELTALVDDREAFQRALLARGVDTQRTWMDACDALPAFADAGGGPCPVARDAAARAVYLPTWAELSTTQRETIVRATIAAAGDGAP